MCVRTTKLLFSFFFLLILALLANGRALGAPTYLAPDDPALGRPVPPAAPPRVAQSHILIELGPGADEASFLERARGQGLRRLGRVSGTRWLTMAIPSGAAPRAAAAAARALPGVSRATPDVVLQAYHHVPPVSPPYVNDPLYIYDDDPSTKPACSPCTAEQIVDQWGLFRVDSESGWDAETGGMRADGKEIVIAIVDSGMDLDHDDLRDNLWHNPNETPDGIDNDGNGFIDDLHGADFVGAGVGSPFDDPASQDANPDIPDTGVWVEDISAPWWWRFDGDPAVGDAMDNNGDFFIDLGVFHGTFVAGIAAAATNNINPETSLFEGFAGACWNCKLMPVRMIDAEGGGLMSNAAAAVRYAADNGAHIINASWGVNTVGLNPADVEILKQAIDYAVGKGVIVVAASGNAGTSGMSFPAAMANTIAVGSSDWVDNRSAFSSYGYSTEIPNDGIDNDSNGWVDDVVDVIAPGELIWSSTVISAYEAFILNGWDWFCCADRPPDPDDWYPGQDAYTRSDGTSFATPLVAGHIGVLLSANCDAGLTEVRQSIRNNALDVGLPGYDAQTGYGRMQFVVPTDLGTGDCGGTGGNTPPLAVNDAYSVTAGGSLSVGAPGVLQNDSDPNGDTITAVLITGPTSASAFSINSDGSFSYTHDGSASTTDAFTYKAVDSGGLESNASTVTITIDTPGGNPNAMYMQDVSFDYKGRALNVTVTVRRDSDADGVAESSDAGVGKAVVHGKLCAVGAPSICHFEGTPIGTGGNGKATYKLFGASGQYQYTWTSIEHPDNSWDSSLDVTNPVVGP